MDRGQGVVGRRSGGGGQGSWGGGHGADYTRRLGLIVVTCTHWNKTQNSLVVRFQLMVFQDIWQDTKNLDSCIFSYNSRVKVISIVMMFRHSYRQYH